ncbi:lectin [Amycolatopsis cihanbeyliensis]
MMSHTRLARRLRIGLAAAITVTAATAGGAVAAEPAAPEPAAPAAQAVTFFDGFDGPAGTPVDGSKWQLETGDNVSNHELQYYTGDTRNAVQDGQGNLVITAREENPAGYQCWYGHCRYTSARLNSAGRFTQAYGHFEARVKMTRGQGMWPAFWLLGNDIGSVGWPASGEIDVMENIGSEPSTVHGTVHGPGYSGANGIGSGYTLPGGQAFADGFHTFAVDWAPDSITWSVDGTVYHRLTPADLGGREWVFDKPFFMILNLAVGGDWPGEPDENTTFPQQLVVDYVRVTQGEGGQGGAITGLNGKCMDVAGAATANGTPVQLHDCNGTAAQRWTVGADGTIRALGKCLDVDGGSTANGTAVQLWDCNGTAAQRWTVTRAGDIVYLAGDSCLDVTGNNPANGTPLQIWTCTGAANQKWTVSAA